MKIEYNKYRVEYLLSFFRMTKEELLCSINSGRKTSITWDDIFSDTIELNHLKRIDKVFNKGLSYYTNPDIPQKDEGMSVFFRKESFSTALNIGARKRVREFEDIKTQISAICKMADFDLKRVLRTYTINDDAKIAALEIRRKISLKFVHNKRDFLKSFINKLGDYNVLVFEFVDTSNKKEKANIDGFYIKPNAIILKRNQDSFKREIFTLAHELGHYLLGHEEIDEIDFLKVTENVENLSAEENWCNKFAYNFLLDTSNAEILESISCFNAQNDYGHDIVKAISDRTHLSRLAIYTNLLIQKKVTYADYCNIRNELYGQWLERQEKKQLQKQNDKEAGVKSNGRNPKPIKSDLVYDIYNYALNKGVISEYEYCTALKIKSNDISRIYYDGNH